MTDTHSPITSEHANSAIMWPRVTRHVRGITLPGVPSSSATTGSARDSRTWIATNANPMTSAIGRTIRVSAAAWPVAAAGRPGAHGRQHRDREQHDAHLHEDHQQPQRDGPRDAARSRPGTMSPMPAGSPRQRRSAATTLASAEIPTAVAHEHADDEQRPGSVVSGAAAKRFCTCDSIVGVISIWSRLATAAGEGEGEEQRPLAAEGVEGAPEHRRDVEPGPAMTLAGSTRPVGRRLRTPGTPGAAAGLRTRVGGRRGRGRRDGASSGVAAGRWASPPAPTRRRRRLVLLHVDLPGGGVCRAWRAGDERPRMTRHAATAGNPATAGAAQTRHAGLRAGHPSR